MQITARCSRLVSTTKKYGRKIAMTVRSPLDVLAIVLGLSLLVIIVVFGAIVDVTYRGRRSGSGYFAGETAPQDQ
jgi:hypothetical protein